MFQRCMISNINLDFNCQATGLSLANEWSLSSKQLRYITKLFQMQVGITNCFRLVSYKRFCRKQFYCEKKINFSVDLFKSVAFKSISRVSRASTQKTLSAWNTPLDKLPNKPSLPLFGYFGYSDIELSNKQVFQNIMWLQM